MESRPILPIQRLQDRQHDSVGSSVRQYSKLQDCHKVSFEREPWTSSIVDHVASAVSNTGIVGNMFSTDSGFTTASTAPFLSQSSETGTSVAQGLHSHPVLLQCAAPGNFARESNDAAWPGDQFFLDFSSLVSGRHDQDEGNVASISQEQTQKCDLQWEEHIMSEDSFTATGWDDLVAESDGRLKDAYRGNETSSGFKIDQPHINQLVPGFSGDSSHVANQNKPRMRWSPELHERFVQAVNHLGGSEKATPKGVVNHMKVEGLTIYHAKSHLQKYRTARYKPETSEGIMEESGLRDISSLDLKMSVEITEALRLQMEVQKQLHEQLEIQRNLQLQIEEQGRYLQVMIEKQSNTNNKFKTPSSLADISVASPSVVTQSSSKNQLLENKQDANKTNAIVNKTEVNSQQSSIKNRVPETGPSKPGRYARPIPN